MTLYVYKEADEPASHYKIGYTGGEPASRVRAQSTGNHRELMLLGSIKANKEHDKISKELLVASGARVRGEWYSRDHQMTRIVVDGLTRGHTPIHVIIRRMQNHLKEVMNPALLAGADWGIDLDVDGISIRLRGLWKECSGCRRNLPLINVYWGRYLRQMTNGEFRDQPQCTDCRPASFSDGAVNNIEREFQGRLRFEA